MRAPVVKKLKETGIGAPAEVRVSANSASDELPVDLNGLHGDGTLPNSKIAAQRCRIRAPSALRTAACYLHDWLRSLV
jgi:hypothetical protein